MKRLSIFLLAALSSTASFADYISGSHCENSTITVYNNTNDILHFVENNQRFRPSHRTRGKIINVTVGDILEPGQSHTITLETGIGSQSAIWGDIGLENEVGQVTRVEFDFIDEGYFEDCKPELLISTENPNYIFSYNAPVATPALAQVHINSMN